MKEITALQLKQKLDKGDKIALIDVREPHEHEEFNIGGMLIPLAEIPSSKDKLAGLEDAEIVLYCRSGNRSAMAQKLLATLHGITNTINLRGGMNSWRDEIKA